jgi:hypothetical protein
MGSNSPSLSDDKTTAALSPDEIVNLEFHPKNNCPYKYAKQQSNPSDFIFL